MDSPKKSFYRAAREELGITQTEMAELLGFKMKNFSTYTFLDKKAKKTRDEHLGALLLVMGRTKFARAVHRMYHDED